MSNQEMAEPGVNPSLSDSKCQALIQLKMKQTKTSTTRSSSKPPTRAKSNGRKDIFKRPENAGGQAVYSAERMRAFQSDSSRTGKGESEEPRVWVTEVPDPPGGEGQVWKKP